MAKLRESPRIIDLPVIEDPRGALSFFEGGNQVPFEIRSSSWVYGIRPEAVHAGCAFMNARVFLVPMSGEVTIVVNDGEQERLFTLGHPGQGLYVPERTWYWVKDCSRGAVALVVMSCPEDGAARVRNYPEFCEQTHEARQ